MSEATKLVQKVSENFKHRHLIAQNFRRESEKLLSIYQNRKWLPGRSKREPI